MKKILLLFTLLLCLASCSRHVDSVATLQEPTPDQQLVASESGLTLSIAEDVFDEAAPLFNTTLANDSDQNFEYGKYYHLELLKEGKWYILTHSDVVFIENPNFTNMGRLLPAGSTVQQTFSVDLLRITLYPGTYRLVKIFLSPEEPYYEVTLAVPFAVN